MPLADYSPRDCLNPIHAHLHMDHTHDGTRPVPHTIVLLILIPPQTLGYQRTLQATDLWAMDSSREAGVLGDKLDAAWARRVAAAHDWNTRLARGEIKPSLTLRAKWCFQAVKKGKGKGWSGYEERRQELEARWREKDGLREASLAWALNDTIGRSFWLGGVFKVRVYPYRRRV